MHAWILGYWTIGDCLGLSRGLSLQGSVGGLRGVSPLFAGVESLVSLVHGWIG